ncbi:hypothetical protein SLS62_001581 [Diatrype stigma]|uniref:Uncharacterized protein n=1 Tax=Diatrype stigma TaxID=117547 RepID=A0AAN9V1I2_9PEZI
MADPIVSETRKGSADNSMAKDMEIGQGTIEHQETSASPGPKGLPSRDLDVAMALFDTPEQIHDPRDPGEEPIFGIRQDLDLGGAEYNWLSSMFYFGFLFWAFPTNFMMQRFPIGFFLMLQAAVKNFAQLLVLRFLAGAAEACADPSFMLITSMWVSKHLCIGSIKGSLPSWKYEFLIIGALCCIWGTVMFIFLPDSPVTAKGLSLAEKRMAVQRLRENQTGIENKHLKAYQVKEAFRDIKLYLFFFLGVVCNVPNGGISNFGTLILQGFGYSTLVTTLLQIPYGVIISISILICVYLNDRFVNRRCIFVLAFLTANTSGHTKKVVTNAVLFLGCRGANNFIIVGPFFYLTEQAPSYSLGIWSMIVSHLLEVVIIVTLWTLLSRENRRRDKLQAAMEGGLEGRDLDSTAFADLTDRENLNFRYIY